MGCSRGGGVYKYRRPEPCAQKGSWSTLPVCRCPGPTSLAVLLCSYWLFTASICLPARGLSWKATLLLLCAASLNELLLGAALSREDGCVCPRRLEWDDCVLHLSPMLVHKMSFLLPAVMFIVDCPSFCLSLLLLLRWSPFSLLPSLSLGSCVNGRRAVRWNTCFVSALRGTVALFKALSDNFSRFCGFCVCDFSYTIGPQILCQRL